MPGDERRIDDCLSTRNGRLFIEQIDTLDIVKQYGTPVFVFSENQLRRNIRRFQEGFAKGWDGPVKVMPAAKANWISAILNIAADEGCGCDIYSPGELSAALKAGIDPKDISANGVAKNEEHIRRCIRDGVRITIDTFEEVDIIEKAASALGITAHVRLRLKPVLSGFTTQSDFYNFVPTDIVSHGYKAGLPLENAIPIGKRILEMDNIELTGFHQHHGRHSRTSRYWEEQMKAYARDIGIVCRELGGYRPGEIDIGGGFACPRDPFNAETDLLEPYELPIIYGLSTILGWISSPLRYRILSKILQLVPPKKPNKNYAPSIEEYADACTVTLKRELDMQGIDTQGVTLQLEPGRSLHGDTAIHLSTITNIKIMPRPVSWNIVVMDTTEFWFTGGRYEHHLHEYIVANNTDSARKIKVDVCGRSCYADRLIPTVLVPEDIKVGDTMAMLDVGAYQEVSMSNFNALPRPATLLVTGDRISVIRRAETEDDVFRRDEIPDHLQSKTSARSGV